MATEKSKLRHSIIRAFKKTVCVEMGRTGSSLIAIQTLPIAWDVALAHRWEPRQFCREAGWSEVLIDDHQAKLDDQRDRAMANAI